MPPGQNPNHSQNPNIYLRCKEYDNEDLCYETAEDNCYWNPDLETPGCRFYVPEAGGGPEDLPADMTDCTLIKTFMKCKEATPNGGLCMWDSTTRMCEEAEECEDFTDEAQCNAAFYEAQNIQCSFNVDTCDEAAPPARRLRRVRPSSLEVSDSVDPIATIATFSLFFVIFFVSAYATYSCIQRSRRKRTKEQFEDHFLQM